MEAFASCISYMTGKPLPKKKETLIDWSVQPKKELSPEQKKNILDQCHAVCMSPVYPYINHNSRIYCVIHCNRIYDDGNKTG